MPAIPRIPGTVDITLFCSGGDTQIRTGDEGFADLHIPPRLPHYILDMLRLPRCIGTHTVTCNILYWPYVSYSIGLRHGLQLLICDFPNFFTPCSAGSFFFFWLCCDPWFSAVFALLLLITTYHMDFSDFLQKKKGAKCPHEKGKFYEFVTF